MGSTTLSAVWRPLFSFLLIGAALFTADRAWRSDAPAAPIVVSSEHLEEIRARVLARTGRLPDAAQLAALIEADVEEELLYREARVRGFDRGDPVVFRRLVQNMRFAGADAEESDAGLYAEALDLGMDRSDPVVRRRLVQRLRLAIEARTLASPPTESELRGLFDARRDRYVAPARVRLAQRFFPVPHAGAPDAPQAERALAALRSRGAGPEDAADVGAPFLHAALQPLQTRDELERRFGAVFAERVFALEVGLWTGPVPSSYGVHLVFVIERVEAAQLSFEQVRDEVRSELLMSRRTEALSDALAALRARTRVVVPDALVARDRSSLQ